MTTINYQLVNYFDVWGNKRDGYEVNNLCKEGEIVLKENATHKDMLQALKEFGFLRKHVRLNMLEIWDDGDMVEFFQRSDRKPICRLELIYN